jgi:anti-anti-sigma factor
VEAGGVYFNVLANGQPYALGTERGKGSHSMAGYHSFELAYLAAVYTNLLITNEPMDFFFRPTAGNLPNNILRVAPDLLPAGSVRIGQVWINGKEHRDFDAENLTVRLPADGGTMKVRVRLVPAAVHFTADLTEVNAGTATISLCGVLDDAATPFLTEQLEAAGNRRAKAIVFDAEDLQSISPEALRALIFQKQKFGTNFDISIVNANKAVVEAIDESGFNDEIQIAELAGA